MTMEKKIRIGLICLIIGIISIYILLDLAIIPPGTEIDNVPIYFKSYPKIEIEKDWKNNQIIWIEGEYIVPKGVGGSQLLIPNTPYSDRIRWARDMSAEGPHVWYVQHIYLDEEDRNTSKIKPPEKYSIVKAKVEIEKEYNKKYTHWNMAKLLELEERYDVALVEKSLEKVSQILPKVDTYVKENFRNYIGTTPYFSYTSNRKCDEYKCVNGINMWFDKFWDPVQHKLLVRYIWSEDISNKKVPEGKRGFYYNVVVGVIQINVETQTIEGIYFDKTKHYFSLPIY